MRLSHAMQPQAPSAQERRIGRLIRALQSLDDRTLSQIGIERREIERFAHAEVAHNLWQTAVTQGSRSVR